jgi:ligand-binding SRPBCC domain-containing protein
MKEAAFRLERSQVVPRPLDEVFAFFSQAENLQTLTPAFLHFQFVTPLPIRIEPGALIEYHLHLCGIPIR